MDTKIDEIVRDLLEGIGTISKSETIVGEPRQAGSATIIPVHRLKIAFGAGSSKAGAHGTRAGGDWGGHGAGGGVEIDPVAAIAISKDGGARLLTVEADERSTTWASLIREVPDTLRKVAAVVGESAAKRLATARPAEGLGEAAPEPEAQALPEKASES
jgi:uncharacterized spore protein YtfJ